MSDLYTLQASSLPASARLLDFYGVEGMSRPYRFDLRFSLAHAESLAFDLDAPLGRRATLTVNADDGTARQRFHGIVSAVESHSERADGAVYASYTDFDYIAKRHGITNRVAEFKMASEVIESVTSSTHKK